MRNVLLILLLCLVFNSCDTKEQKPNSLDPINWEKRTISSPISGTTELGRTFLSVYSQIHLRTANDESELTSTISIHNPNIQDRIYIESATYYNTEGEAIRTYFEQTIYVDPMETVQIVIDGNDNEGGTGANFIFDWIVPSGNSDPIMEAIMVSTYSSQGISFVTNGRKVKR